MGYVRPPPLIFTSFLLTRALSQQCLGQPSSFEVSVSFFKCRYGWCQRPPRSPLLQADPLVPQGSAEEREGEGEREMERGEGQT